MASSRILIGWVAALLVCSAALAEAYVKPWPHTHSQAASEPEPELEHEIQCGDEVCREDQECLTFTDMLHGDNKIYACKNKLNRPSERPAMVGPTASPHGHRSTALMRNFHQDQDYGGGGYAERQIRDHAKSRKHSKETRTNTTGVECYGIVCRPHELCSHFPGIAPKKQCYDPCNAQEVKAACDSVLRICELACDSEGNSYCCRAKFEHKRCRNSHLREVFDRWPCDKPSYPKARKVSHRRLRCKRDARQAK